MSEWPKWSVTEQGYVVKDDTEELREILSLLVEHPGRTATFVARRKLAALIDEREVGSD